MKILTAREMKEIDRTAIEEIGIPGVVLMENAGVRIVRALKGRVAKPADESVVIVAGKGNNGGDGLVVARHLFNSGVRPEVLLFATKEEVRGDAAVNLSVVLKLGIPVTEIRSPAEWKKSRVKVFHATVIVDALFGTGLLKPLDGLFALAVEDINKSAAFKVAVDIPSGLSSDTFELIGPCVKADLTVALAAPKIAHVFPPAAECVGELVVAPIGIPPFLFEKPGWKIELVEGKTVLPFFTKRQKDTHKGSYGHVLVIAGSVGKTGAAALAGKAALRMGAGLVTVATAASALPIVARSMAELMTEPLAESVEKTIAREALPRALVLLKGKNAVLLGPGLSTHSSTAEFVLGLLPKIKIPCVIDADGLNIVAAKPDLLRRLSAPAVLTPHPGEFARLVGRSAADVLKYRLELVPAFAGKYGVTVVLKGYRTLVASPDGRVFVNPTGNPGMATGGTGDVLGGFIASQVVQVKDFLGAVLSAVFVHGLAGDIAAEKLGERSVAAGELIRYLPPALKALAEEGAG
ncbi:MAG: NAD(P)H-hydrate dehydratase [Candidatus Aminicenantes bacterium]|nr:NAD(P)H-hydrate dehydratase [Candidatus Aminicenantes bacterium]